MRRSCLSLENSSFISGAGRWSQNELGCNDWISSAISWSGSVAAYRFLSLCQACPTSQPLTGKERAARAPLYESTPGFNVERPPLFNLLGWREREKNVPWRAGGKILAQQINRHRRCNAWKHWHTATGPGWARHICQPLDLWVVCERG